MSRFFCGWRSVPAFSNSPTRRYLSNAPYPVPQFALQPQFWPSQPPPRISLFCVCAEHTAALFFQHVPLFGCFRAKRRRTPPQNPAVSVSNTPFLPRNSPRSWSAENAFLTQLFCNFPLNFFLRVARRATQLRKLLAFSQPRWVISLLMYSREEVYLRKGEGEWKERKGKGRNWITCTIY